MKNYLYCSRPLCSFDGAMCVDSSPRPVHTESALTTPRVVRRTPFGNGAHHERKGNWRKLGRMTCCRGKRLRFEEMDERGQPSSHSCCAEEAVRCQRLTRAQTTWHLEVDAVNSLHKAQLRHARGEGEENIALARISQFHEKAFTASHQAHKPI